MKEIAGLALLFSIGCMGLAKRDRAGAPPPEAALEYLLKSQESYAVGSPVRIGFELRNLSDQTIYVLKWYTPLEGLFGNIFRVTRDGEEIPYQGPMAKRGDPGPEEYVELQPRGSVSAEVDLSAGYDLSRPGSYQLEFKGQLFDVVTQKRLVPRARDKHRGESISGNKVTFRMVQP